MTDYCPVCHQPVPYPLPTPAAWFIRTPAGRETRLSAHLVEVAQVLHDAPNQIEAAGILGISRATLQRERSHLLAALDVDTLLQAIAFLVEAHLVHTQT
jgi:hypothetical protein